MPLVHSRAYEVGVSGCPLDKSDVEYGTALMPVAKTETLLRRARSLVELAVRIVRLGG